MINRKEIQTNQIWNLLESIEDLVGLMAHEIDGLRDYLREWQDGKRTGTSLINILTGMLDDLRSERI